METVDLIQSTTNNDYVLKIRSRMQEDTQARKEREKRRRKVLVDQLKATESLEVKSKLFEQFQNLLCFYFLIKTKNKDSRREEALVARLLRQSQFERRVAVELLHARHEKDVIRDNRIAKERDILEKREEEYLESLNRERVGPRKESKNLEN